MGGRSDSEPLLNELRTYQTIASFPVHVPRLRWYHADDALVVMVMDRVQAEPLANRRNAFAVSDIVHVGAVLEEIRKLQAVDIPGDWVSAYHRGQKILAYLEVIHSHLPARMVRVLGSVGTQWDSGRCVVLSHGDPIPPNIMVRDGCYWFVDWEWAGLRPPSYHPALFLLFSRQPHEALSLFDKLGGPWDTRELYRDSVVLAAREIKNWLTQVKPSAMQIRYVQLWRDALQQGLQRLGLL